MGFNSAFKGLIYIFLFKGDDSANAAIVCVWCCCQSYKNKLEKWQMLPFCHAQNMLPRQIWVCKGLD